MTVNHKNQCRLAELSNCIPWPVFLLSSVQICTFFKRDDIVSEIHQSDSVYFSLKNSVLCPFCNLFEEKLIHMVCNLTLLFLSNSISFQLFSKSVHEVLS